MRNYISLCLTVVCLFSVVLYGQISVDQQMRNVHDPSMIYSDGYYYVYSTGSLDVRRSQDLIYWDYMGRVMPNIPQWVQDKVEGVSDIWAPDVTYYNGKYYICYSASTFGSQTSLLGLLSNETLNPYASNYEWVDEGEILSSPPSGSPTYNAIDGTFVEDANGDMWLVFGSYWEGIMLTPLNNSTLKPTTTPPTIYQLARRNSSTASEASYIIYRDGYYYLFVNWDSCCSGVDSTYQIVVGRSTSITGPYVDKAGRSMLYGTGGTLFVGNNGRWIGPGHADITTVNGQDYFSYHVYDGNLGGTPTLRVNEMGWDQAGWPVLGDMVGVVMSEGNTVGYWDFEDGENGLPFYDMPIHGSVDRVNGYVIRGYDSTYGPSYSDITYNGSGLSAYCNGIQDGYTLDAPLNGWEPERWTIEVSVMLNSLAGWNTIIGRDGSSRSEAESDFYLQNDGLNDSFRVNLATVGGQRWVLDSDYVQEAGQWYHLALTCDGATLLLYCDALDGNGYQEIGRQDMSAYTSAENALATSGVWTFGRGWYNGNLVDQIDGYIDNVRFSDKALAKNELLFYEPVTIVETDGNTRLYSNSAAYTDSYTLVLNNEPVSSVNVMVAPSSGISVGRGSGVVKTLAFDSSNWNQEQTVVVSITEPGSWAGSVKTIGHYVVSSDDTFDDIYREVSVSIEEDVCGTWGYLPGDLNSDCVVDMYDFELLAVVWLDGDAIQDLSDLAYDWLSSTLIYNEDIFDRSIIND